MIFVLPWTTPHTDFLNPYIGLEMFSFYFFFFFLANPRQFCETDPFFVPELSDCPAATVIFSQGPPPLFVLIRSIKRGCLDSVLLR
jgi:hypothetical protein